MTRDPDANCVPGGEVASGSSLELGETIAELVDQYVPMVQAAAVQALIEVVEKEARADRLRTVPEVLNLMRETVSLYEGLANQTSQL